MLYKIKDLCRDYMKFFAGLFVIVMAFNAKPNIIAIAGSNADLIIERLLLHLFITGALLTAISAVFIKLFRHYWPNINSMIKFLVAFPVCALVALGFMSAQPSKNLQMTAILFLAIVGLLFVTYWVCRIIGIKRSAK